MKQLLVPIAIVVVALATSVTSYLMGRRAAMESLQVGLRQLAEASRQAAHKPDPEDEMLEDPPEVVPVDAEKQAELSLATLEAMKETAEPGSLRFDNPDVVNLLVQFRRRQEYIEDRERRLKELEDRLKLELQNLNLATQWLARTRISQDQMLTTRLKYITEEEQGRLQEHARRLTSLNPAQAVAILTNFAPPEIAKTLMMVGPTNSANLLGALIASGPEGPKNAAEISKLMLRMTLRSPESSTNTPAPTAK
jgi:hypothetical protein